MYQTIYRPEWNSYVYRPDNQRYYGLTRLSLKDGVALDADIVDLNAQWV